MVQVHLQKQATHATSANEIWNVWAQFSDVSWHPWVARSENAGAIPDGSTNMVGATRRLIEEGTGHELVERVVAWDETKRSMTVAIDKGGPSFAKSFLVTFQVYEKEENGK